MPKPGDSRGYDKHKHAKRGPLTEAEKLDRALLSVMKDWNLKPGQMLFLGPKSVAAITSGDYHPAKMVDKYILDRHEWSVV